ncbi:MAG TPA: retroviral-like aspartic protease family protein [Allosphingosinicella sp.]|nr:retroviral-like aspartic protease family protein [Allosphingosinicella sp.]
MKSLVALLLLASAPLAGQEVPESGPEAATVIDVGADRNERMTVQVDVDGRGPFAFLVDTGAERTSISAELADDLDLVLGRKARLHSMTEVSQIQTVVIPALTVGGNKVRDINAPTLLRRNIGAEGILGIDTLRKQRVSFDFARAQMTVSASRKREEKWPEDTIVVTARNRVGHLVLVDASVDGQKVWVIIDTGAQTTVGNSVLRRKLAAKGRIGRTWPIELQSVTGGRMAAEATLVKLIRLGGSDIHDMPVAFADVHPFKALRLTDRPALLLGMDALRLFERVSVDFANRRVRLLPPERSERGGTDYAAAD